jgi:hypothetical protein
VAGIAVKKIETFILSDVRAVEEKSRNVNILETLLGDFHFIYLSPLLPISPLHLKF